MSNFKNAKLAAPVAAILVGGIAQGCSASDGGEEECGAQIAANVKAVGTSVDALVSAADDMRADMSIACSAIADGEEDDSLEGDDLEAKCGEASAMIEAQFSADANLSITFQPAQCSVNAEAQLDCEASCSVEGECDPGSVDVRCDPGELSVVCEGECSAEVSCEAEANASVECEGTCSGTCEGTCSGTCTGECDGECSAEVMNSEGEAECRGECDGTCMGSCEATCEGSCEGSCTFDADASVECDGEARCHGECDGDFTAPKCEGELDPPECDLDADCQAGCDGQAKFEAECTPPSIVIEGGAEADAEVIASIQANLPQVVAVLAKTETFGMALVDVGDAIVNVSAEVTDAGAACVAAVGGKVSAQVDAAVEASASVEVSASASADVSGSASGG